MISYVTHSSALRFIRQYGSEVSFAQNEPFSCSVCAYRIRDLSPNLFERYGFAKPLHVVCGDYSIAKSSSVLHVHRASAFPASAFKRIEGTLAVAAPELVFLQMAGQYQLPHLVMLGYELCGSYSLNRVYSEGFLQHEPFTSVSAIDEFLSEMERVNNARYVNRARRALRFVSDDSNSPKETEIAMLLCMSLREGGFGLPLPAMNYEIRLNKEAMRIYPVHYCKADLCWPAQKLCVEYDSDAVHATVEHLNKDSARRNALELMGFRVITVTRSQLCSPAAFEEVVRLISKHIGKRIQIRNDCFSEKHAKLREYCGL